jgi:uncharacterized membrane protein
MSHDDAMTRTTGCMHVVAAAVLGFAFGGFFDGILLHQVLQWHHFLSLVPGERYQHLETQILADGLFHVVVYLIALTGLVMLWHSTARRPADRVLAAWAVLGFSIWQFSDVVLFHWIVGIHRIRVGVPNPLLWDLGWLAAFGVTTLLIGLWLLLKAAPNSGNTGRRSAAVISGVIIISASATLLPSGSSSTVVIFRPGMQASQTFAAASTVDADVLWSDPSGRILVLAVPPNLRTWSLYAQGALLVGNTGATGCLNWTRV